jgi:hypothetical protein
MASEAMQRWKGVVFIFGLGAAWRIESVDSGAGIAGILTRYSSRRAGVVLTVGMGWADLGGS